MLWRAESSCWSRSSSVRGSTVSKARKLTRFQKALQSVPRCARVSRKLDRRIRSNALHPGQAPLVVAHLEVRKLEAVSGGHHYYTAASGDGAGPAQLLRRGERDAGVRIREGALAIRPRG